MNKQTQAISNEINHLTDSARELLSATAGVAEETVEEARKHLAAALDHGKNMCDRVLEIEDEGVRSANEFLHQHPYESIAIGVGIGAFMGYLLARRCHCCHG